MRREQGSLPPQSPSLFTLNVSLLPNFSGAKKAALPGGLFVLDFSGYLYISGFSMVSTFRNWEVPREAFRASPATQAT